MEGRAGRGEPVPAAAASLLHEPEAAKLRAAAAADAAAARREYLLAPPACLHKPLSRLLSDPRDLPILFLLINVCLTTAPAAAALFLCFPAAARPLPHWLGASYLAASYAAYLGRFMLSLHYSEHRPLFRAGALLAVQPAAAAAAACAGWHVNEPGLALSAPPPRPRSSWPPGLRLLNLLAPVLLAPLFGVPPCMYWWHHVVLHHGGNNRWGADVSSTERYRRDSLPAFLAYLCRYVAAAWAEVPLRCLRTRRWAALAGSVAAEAAYFGGAAAAWRANPRAALWVLLLPYALSSLALMFGK